MEMNEYQKLAMRTSIQHPHWGDKLDNAILGLSGEIGEVTDSWKKHKYHGHTFDPRKMMEELGDLLWYLAQAADAIGYPLNVVARNNIEKLEARYPSGFSSERSINR